MSQFIDRIDKEELGVLRERPESLLICFSSSVMLSEVYTMEVVLVVGSQWPNLFFFW